MKKKCVVIILVLLCAICCACNKQAGIEEYEPNLNKLVFQIDEETVDAGAFYSELSGAEDFGVYIVVSLNYPSYYEEDNGEYSTVEEAQRAHAEITRRANEYYLTKSNEIVAKLKINAPNMTISTSFPALMFLYDSFDEFLGYKDEFERYTSYEEIVGIRIKRRTHDGIIV